MAVSEFLVTPQWTEKLYLPSLGQDHLGLGSGRKGLSTWVTRWS